MKTIKLSVLSSVIAAIAAMPVDAQAGEAFTLEEIIVTAQKRAESLQDVPISVSAMGSEKISEAGIENLQDLSAYVPNLRVVEGSLVPQLFIRGIGSGTNQGFEQSVGTYSDGVYAGRSMQSRSAFMDLERVEVLRGPQSILFGQSSIAGAISLVSAKPTDEFEGMVSASHAPEFDETEVNAFVSGPLTESVSARLALRDRQQDGYMENKTTNADGPVLDEQAARLTLDWEGDNLTATFKAELARVEQEGRTMTPLDLGVYPTLAAVGTHGALQQTSTQLGHDTYSDADNNLSFDSDSFFLKLDYDLGNHVLTSITAYSEYDFREDNFDADTTEVDAVTLHMGEDFEQYSQELRLTSPGGETLDYIVGLFYQTSEQRYQEQDELQLSSIGLDLLAGQPQGSLDVLLDKALTQQSDTYAAFAQLTWNINDRLRTNIGLRYTKDEKQGARDQASYELFAPDTLLSGVPAAVAALGFNIANHSLEEDYSEENWTPSLNLQYDLTDDIMVYANYSEGYKAAGFDARGINGWTAGANPFAKSGTQLGGESFFFDQEEAETFELGAKMSLLDGAAELNVSLYETEYSNMQVSVFDGAFGFAVQNAGEARVRGLEMDGRWRVSEAVTLTSSLGYLDFEWVDYKAGACNGISGSLSASPTISGNCDYSGRENLHTPEWTFNLSANHVAPVGDNFELRSTLDANFKDNHYVSGDLDPRSEQAAVTIFNGRIALASVEDTWQLALTGKNLTNQDVFSYGGPIAQSRGGLFVNMMRPRTLAMEGLYRF